MAAVELLVVSSEEFDPLFLDEAMVYTVRLCINVGSALVAGLSRAALSLSEGKLSE